MKQPPVRNIRCVELRVSGPTSDVARHLIGALGLTAWHFSVAAAIAKAAKTGKTYRGLHFERACGACLKGVCALGH